MKALQRIMQRSPAGCFHLINGRQIRFHHFLPFCFIPFGLRKWYTSSALQRCCVGRVDELYVCVKTKVCKGVRWYEWMNEWMNESINQSIKLTFQHILLVLSRTKMHRFRPILTPMIARCWKRKERRSRVRRKKHSNSRSWSWVKGQVTTK